MFACDVNRDDRARWINMSFIKLIANKVDWRTHIGVSLREGAVRYINRENSRNNYATSQWELFTFARKRRQYVWNASVPDRTADITDVNYSARLNRTQTLTRIFSAGYDYITTLYASTRSLIILLYKPFRWKCTSLMRNRFSRHFFCFSASFNSILSGSIFKSV